MRSKFVAAAVQMAVSSSSKAANIAHARKMIAQAVTAHSAQLVVLPEIWNGPYDTQQFAAFAETVPGGESSAMLQEEAKRHGIVLVGGSIPEVDDGKVFNTSTVWGPDGSLLGKHRKVHLFDIDVKGGQTFRESDTLSAGSDITVVETPLVTLGLGICYDVRFPELSHLMRRRGAELLVYPAAFNPTTGPLHWDLLMRARAVDTQCWVMGVSSALSEGASYKSWGHSLVVDPWGEIKGQLGREEGITAVELDAERLGVRDMIPVWKQKRHDLYQVVEK